MGKKVYINLGHSDKDPGAVGDEKERELIVKVGTFQRDYLLENYDCEVRMNPGTMNSTREVAADANAWGADLMDSKHFNAGRGDGWEGLVYSSKNVAMGKIFEKHVLAAGQNSRGVKLRPDLNILALTNMPAIINEGAFVDNQKDIQDWNEDHELKKLAIAYAEADAEFLQLKKKVAATQPAEPEKQYIYRVQVGAYSKKTGAETMLKQLRDAGFGGIIVKAEK